jgi:hypothetical protein
MLTAPSSKLYASSYPDDPFVPGQNSNDDPFQPGGLIDEEQVEKSNVPLIDDPWVPKQ